MLVKKYRAATTREALEQVKQDLGEDAFVLETKKVRAGGFLGMGTQMQIEISAATSNDVTKPAAKAERKSKLKLNLTDDTAATPKHSFEESFENDSQIPVSMTNGIAKSLARSAKAYGNILSLEQPKIETVELSENAPQIVHARKETAKVVLPEQPAVVIAESPAAISSREIELLRAELRELKFSLGSLSNRQSAPQTQKTPVVVYDSPFYEAYTALTQTGVSTELARKFIDDIIPHYKSGFIKDHELTQEALIYGLTSLIKFEENPLESQQPAIMAVIGATGVGKTTTIAKIAARVALHERRPVELVTLDTYRIAAVEQLKTYAEIIGAGCHVARSVFELDATLRRLPQNSTVLIDTTGKNPHDLADQYELADYLKGRSEIRKCLAMQATTNLHDGLAAIKKYEMYGADCLALTKLDETTRPGAMVKLAESSNLPLVYLCNGQRVPEDLQSATVENFTQRILGTKI
jgi:flagellar biosynthesis protein FlhF